MKHLGKFIIVIVLLAFVSNSYGQFLVGAKVGMNISNMVNKDDDDTWSDDWDSKIGFHVGPAFEIGIANFFSIESGLILSTRGFKQSEESGGEEWSLKLNLLYLDIPINTKFSFDVGSAKIFATVGPYFGVGLSGKVKEEYSYGGETEKDEWDIEWGSDEEEDDLKRLDIGLTAGAGVQINIIRIYFHYDLGLANLSPYTENGYTINNRNIGISVAVLFGGGGGDNTRD